MNASEMRAVMRDRQQRWMSARATERDRAEVFSEIASQSNHVDERKGVLLGLVDSNEVLARVTERIHERLQRELRKEQAGRWPDAVHGAPVAVVEDGEERGGGEGGGGTGSSSGAAVRNHIEDYLRTELQSLTCLICMDIMQPPDKAPMLLFPCGHSFCRLCITKNIEANGKKCPYCRGRIRSMAVNHSLKSLIDDFLVERRCMETKPASIQSGDVDVGRKGGVIGSGESVARSSGGPSSLEGEHANLTESSYRRNYQALCVRCRILQNELEDAKKEDAGIGVRMHAVALATKRMEKEVELANAKVLQAQKELALASSHLEEQRRKSGHLLQKQEKVKAGAKLIQSTLEALIAEKEKARILAEGLATRK